MHNAIILMFSGHDIIIIITNKKAVINTIYEDFRFIVIPSEALQMKNIRLPTIQARIIVAKNTTLG